MNKIVIGLGNTGSVIVRLLASKKLTDVKLFAIDSQMKHVTLDTSSLIKYIPIVADDNVGSGRDRERGKAMFEFNDQNGAMKELYDMCGTTDTIFIVSSSSGGTGSGSCPALCSKLFERYPDTKVIPIIICPNDEDPDAYHLNTKDLMVELNEANVGPYSIFCNPNSSDYEKINNEIVESILVMLGTKYEHTDNDSIDASDLKNVLSTKGRIVALSVTGDTVDEVRKKLTKSIVSSFQPTWDPTKLDYSMAAFSMKSINAGEDSKIVENDIMPKLERCYDIYKNIVIDDNNGKVDVTLMVAGLPAIDLKEIELNYNEAGGIGDNLQKTERPTFMKRRHVKFNNFKSKTDDKVSFE